MFTPQAILYLLAVIVFAFGALDFPRFGATRCISLGLALIVLAQIVSH